MNPEKINDTRSVVWTVTENKAMRDAGYAYCIYRFGSLYRENLTVHDFLNIYNNLKAR